MPSYAKNGMIVSVSLVVLVFLYIFLARLHLGNEGRMSFDYETVLFDTAEPMRLDITIDGDDWAAILDDPTAEIYYPCDVAVGGKIFYEVAIRPKGNTSLSSIAMDADNDRYSFKLEFDHYISSQTCFGLDKLVLNNSYADNTCMKESLVFDMYKFLGADASLYNYAVIYINGEYWGCYVALEAVEDSFLLRNCGTDDCGLYKPDSFNMGNRDKESGGLPDFDASEEPEETPEPTPVPTAEPDPLPPVSEAERTALAEKMGLVTETETKTASLEMPSFEMPDFGSGFGGASRLVYSDDELSSYSVIWNGAVNDSDDSDHRRVVEALKGAQSGDTAVIEECLDVDNMLKYMAVHSFVFNEDSMTGGMAHNYYLLERTGQLSIIPWDYNTAFGGMHGGSGDAGTEMVNDPIDTPFEGTTIFDVLLESGEYLARYHEYYRQLVEEYVFGGGFDAFYDRTRSQIDGLVCSDPNSRCTYEEYLAAAEVLYTTVKLRGEGVLGQLNGEIPSTDEAQLADSAAFVDGSAIDINIMGTFMTNMGGGFSSEPSGEAAQSSSRELTQEPEEAASGDTASAEPASSREPDFFASGEPENENGNSPVWTALAYLGLLLLAWGGICLYIHCLRQPGSPLRSGKKRTKLQMNR